MRPRFVTKPAGFDGTAVLGIRALAPYSQWQCKARPMTRKALDRALRSFSRRPWQTQASRRIRLRAARERTCPFLSTRIFVQIQTLNLFLRR